MIDLQEWQRQAEIIIRQMAQDYPQTALQEINTMRELCVQALLLPQQQKKDLITEEVFRKAHDLKGQGGTFDYPLITKIGNALCRYIENQSVFHQPQMRMIERHIAAMEVILTERLTADGGPKGRTLLKSLRIYE